MKISINELSLENFKGISFFSFLPDGKNATIIGDNGEGKTTIMDGFLWLLTDKDSRGNSQFSIKTLGEDGEPKHNLDHSVSAVLNVDGSPLTLKKVYKEVYTKKRGDTHKTLTRHTVDYFIDMVPVQKKEWDERLDQLVDEEILKLITNQRYFNSLPWQDRRNILFDVCGNVTDEAVIENSNGDLDELPTYLEGRKIEEHKKIVKNKRIQVNRRLEEIPARIDELSKSIAEASKINVKDLESQIEALDKEIQAVKDDTGISELRKKRVDLEATLAEKKAERDKKFTASIKEMKDLIDDLERSERDMTSQRYALNAEIESLGIDIKEKLSTMEVLRSSYGEIFAQKPNVKDTCPTCGQALPEDEVSAAIDKFNQDKAEKLADINRQGESLKTKTEELEKKKAALERDQKDLDDKLSIAKAEIKALAETIPEKGADPPSMVKLAEQISEVQKLISEYQIPDVEPLEQKRAELQAYIAEANSIGKTEKRIDELEKEERTLAQELLELEKQLWLMERFTVHKAWTLEKTINSKFELARFKLFEPQINGGIKDVCITTYKGVPYGDALNTGAEINLGLDIVRTLSEHYGVWAPVWVDHAESVTQLIDPGSQLIRLVVIPDRELKAEV